MSEERLGAAGQDVVVRPTVTPRPNTEATFTASDALLIVAQYGLVREARASAALDRDQTHSIDDGCPGGHR